MSVRINHLLMKQEGMFAPLEAYRLYQENLDSDVLGFKDIVSER